MKHFLAAVSLLTLLAIPTFAQTYNQDFENAGNGYFQSPLIGKAQDGSTADISEARAHGGVKSAHLSYKFSGTGWIDLNDTEYPTVVQSGDKLHVSMWIYGSGQPDFTGVSFLVVDAGNETFQYWLNKDVVAALNGTGWTRFQDDIDVTKFTGHWGGKNNGILAKPLKFLGLGLDHHSDTAAQGEVFLDDLSFTGDAGAVAAGAPAVAPQLALKIDAPDPSSPLYDFVPGAQVAVRVQAQGLPAGQSTAVHWQATDFEDQPVSRGDVTLDSTEAGTIALTAGRPGIVYVTATIPDSSGSVLASANTRFAVVAPQDVPAADRDSRLPLLFAVCAHLGRGNADKEMAAMNALGFRACRFDFNWGAVEAQRGVWTWDFYDHVFDVLGKDDIAPLPVAAYTARWATTGDPNAADWHQWNNMPPVTADYAEFVKESAQRYGDRAPYWEIWNEPDIAFWLGTPEQYATLFDAAYTAIKSVAPHAQVMNGGFSEVRRRPDFVPDWQKALHVKPDILAYHSHGVFSNLLRADDFVRGYLHEADWNMPVWLNEAGYSSIGGHSEKAQAINLVKKMSYAPALGDSGYVWYDLINDGVDPNDNESNFGLLRADYTPKAASVAVLTLIRTLSGQKFVRRIDIPGEASAYALVFGRPDNKGGTLVLWNEADSVTPYFWRVPGAASRVSIMGDNTPLHAASHLVSCSLSPEPQYLRFSGSPDGFQVAERPLDFDSPLYAAPGETVPLHLTLHNPLSEPLRGTLTLAPSGSWTVDRTTIPVNLAAGARKDWSVGVTAPPSIGTPQDIAITLSSPSLPEDVTGDVTLKSAVVIPKVASAPTLGDFSAWTTPVASLGRANVVSLYEATPMKELQYHGDADLSAKIYMERVPQGLRVAVRVQDDIFSQDEPPGAEWQGDSVQFAIALASGASYEWTVALTKNGPIADLDTAPMGATVGPTTLPESIVRQGTQTLYDVIVPNTLPGGATLPDHFAFTLLVNDNDSAGRKGWIEWTPGIGRSKDITQFQPIEVR